MSTMVEISATMVKELRERSGAAMMDCKKALVETSGDFDKAFEWLRQKGVAVAQKKSARSASEGLVVAKVADNGKTGSIAEINCETDFVARNDEFVSMTKELVELALAEKAKNADDLLAKSIKGTKVSDFITEKIAKTGENIIIRRVGTVDLGSKPGLVGLYVHALGGKMGALVAIESNKELNGAQVGDLGKDLAMHIVSAKPQFVSRNEIPAEVIENEKRIESGKADLAEKKPEMREKIVQGRVDKLLAERCLLDQPFVKDPSQTIAQFLSKKGSELGVELKPTSFVMFILGESEA
jgi:elongation factor Ts